MMRTSGTGLEADALGGKQYEPGTESPSPSILWTCGTKTSWIGFSRRLCWVRHMLALRCSCYLRSTFVEHLLAFCPCIALFF